MERDDHIQHIYRWYDLEEEARGADSFLVNLCWACATERGHFVDHAETPDEGETMECEDCNAINEAAAGWRVAMFTHNLGEEE